MSRFARQMLLMGLLVAVSIFFGIDLATKGMERIQGPVPSLPADPGEPWPQQSRQQGSSAPAQPANGSRQGSAVPVQPSAAAQQSGTGSAQAPKREPAAPAAAAPEQRPAVAEQSPINHIANKVGELLQILAYHGIRWVVSLFDGIID